MQNEQKKISFIMRKLNTFGFDKSRYQSCESKIHMLARVFNVWCIPRSTVGNDAIIHIRYFIIYFLNFTDHYLKCYKKSHLLYYSNIGN